jgi:hypothetical protein
VRSVPSPAPSTPAPLDRERTSHGVVVWALVGVGWLAICIKVVVGWVASDHFGPAPVLPGDTMPTHSLVMLRVVEAASVVVLLASAYVLGWKPWRARRVVTVEALMVLGGVAGFVADSFLNVHDFLFMFNAHSVNLGAWSSELPFFRQGVPTGYGEALLWGLPMYVYFCCALGAMGVALRRRLLAARPSMSETMVLALMWVGFFVFDFVVENAIIRLSEAYSFTRTPSSLTLWAGSQFQFPIYESVCVAFVALAFAAVRLSADRSADGLSFVERGVTAFPRGARLPLRALAAIGYCAVVLVLVYHLPVNWLGVGADSVADVPSYLTPSP